MDNYNQASQPQAAAPQSTSTTTMASVPRLAKRILELLKANILFTDLQIKAGSFLSYRAPRGYLKDEQAGEITQGDINEFAAFSDPEWEKLIEEGDGQFDVAFNIGKQVRLRCNFFLEGAGNALSLAVRKLPVIIPSMAELGVPPRLKGLLYSNVQGLILITGPMGAGKTTTQVSLLDDLNKGSPLHIITIEQPIEYVIKSDMAIVTQREVLKNVQSFSKAMFTARRQRPEVIMIGEIRDNDTIQTCLEAADSGVLVIAGMHAKSPEDAIDTLLRGFSGNELVAKRTQLSTALLAINSQRLLPSKDGTRNVLVYDLLENSPIVARAIKDGATSEIPTLIKNNKGNSMRLNDVLVSKIKTDEISVDDAFKASRNAEELAQMLNIQKPIGF